MSRIAIHWQPTSVAVACYTGPEQEPTILLDAQDERLTGNLYLLKDGRTVLDCQGLLEPNSPPVARIRRVSELLDAPLSRFQIDLLESGGAATILEDEDGSGAVLLRVGETGLSGEDILIEFLTQLRGTIVQKIERTPRLCAALGHTPNKDWIWIFIVEDTLPRKCRTKLERRLQAGGYLNACLDDTWAAVCRWYEQGTSNSHPTDTARLIYDWNDRHFSVAVCTRRKDGSWDCQRKECCTSANLGGIARQIEKQICTAHNIRQPLGPAEPSEGFEDEYTPAQTAPLRRIAYQFACDAFADRPIRSRTIDVVTHHPDNGTAEPLTIRIDAEDVMKGIAISIEKIRNIACYIKYRYAANAASPLFLGHGFSLPHAASAIATALGIDDTVILGRDPHAAAKGAILKEHTFAFMPYDCGVAVSRFVGLPPLGWQMARRGSRFPLEEKKVIRFYLEDDTAVGISIYLRKPDLSRGTLHYTIHGFYNFTPQGNGQREAVLEIIMVIDKTGEVNLTVADQVSQRQIRLKKMGIVGGTALEHPPLHDLQEWNGMASVYWYRVLAEAIREQNLDSNLVENLDVCRSFLKANLQSRFINIETLISDLQSLIACAGARIGAARMETLRKRLADGTKTTDVQARCKAVMLYARELQTAYISYFTAMLKNTPWAGKIEASLSGQSDFNILMQEIINQIETEPRWQSLKAGIEGLPQTLFKIQNIIANCKQLQG